MTYRNLIRLSAEIETLSCHIQIYRDFKLHKYYQDDNKRIFEINFDAFEKNMLILHDSLC